MEDKKVCGCHHTAADDNAKDINKGISCDVTNCSFHTGKCYCTADQIAVGPREASTSADTLCATFKHREE